MFDSENRHDLYYPANESVGNIDVNSLTFYLKDLKMFEYSGNLPYSFIFIYNFVTVRKHKYY